ncbi:MAG TPA: IS1634 family transposase, partial [Burkholderiaceae bacterium]|nr:IS1634 family transposase [Burkholderiaceae bacterium]
TNAADLNAGQVVERYKSLADIERGFRVLKSELEIGPVYHRLPERIRAHASICFMALILHRVMRWRLKAADSALSPERALETLRRIQHHRVRLNGSAPVTGVSSISAQQAEVLDGRRTWLCGVHQLPTKRSGRSGSGPGDHRRRRRRGGRRW